MANLDILRSGFNLDDHIIHTSAVTPGGRTRPIIAINMVKKRCIKITPLLDSIMTCSRLMTCDLKRRFVTIFLAVFSFTAMTGPLVHVYAGESFNVIGQDHRSVHSIDLHDADHGHSHDDERSVGSGQSHSHDHNPGDHSHEVPGFVMTLINAHSAMLDTRYLVFVAQQSGRTSFNIDRPPRR